MIKLLQFLISGCFHEWEIHDTSWFEDKDGSYVYACGTAYHLRCKKCGQMKYKKMK